MHPEFNREELTKLVIAESQRISEIKSEEVLNKIKHDFNVRQVDFVNTYIFEQCYRVLDGYQLPCSGVLQVKKTNSNTEIWLKNSSLMPELEACHILTVCAKLEGYHIGFESIYYLIERRLGGTIKTTSESLFFKNLLIEVSEIQESVVKHLYDWYISRKLRK